MKTGPKPKKPPASVANIQQELASRELCRRRLLPFVLRNVKEYEVGWVHKEICEKLEKFEQDIIDRKSPRLMIFLPPRSGKSELASIQFPAWFLGRNPSKEIISSSYSSGLSLAFSRKVRGLLREPRYKSLFPNCELARDSQSTEHWVTTESGQYLASGVGTGITGHGCHCLIVDDPVKDRISAESPTDRQNVWDWYSSTAYTRLMPGGGVLIMNTRWHVDDLAGRLLTEMKSKTGDQWEILTYPAIAVHDEKHRKTGEALHPERYDLKALNGIKKAIVARDWGALYQQDPSTEEGAILKRGYWNRWLKPEPPECEYIIQSYDTAYSKSEVADYSAITTWGLFYPEGKYSEHELATDEQGMPRETSFNGDEAHLILLDAVKGRWSFPELKDKAYQLYDYWSPDSTIIEGKASGVPLAHEMRKTGIPVQTFVPTRGNDKHTRVHAVSDVFASGYVWAPKNSWADDLIEECHRFPAGKFDDLLDSTIQAVARFRKGGFIRLISDDDVEFTPRARRSYY